MAQNHGSTGDGHEALAAGPLAVDEVVFAVGSLEFLLAKGEIWAMK